METQIIQLYKPHPAQQQVLREKQRFNVVCCGRRWGKSKLSVNLLSEPAIESNPVSYFTPTYKLLKETFNDCLRVLDPIVSRKSDQEVIELVTGGIIDFWSMDNPYAGRSRKYKRAIVDEAAFAKQLFESWTEAIRPTLTDLKGDAFFFSTPRGKNDFNKLFIKGKSGEQDWASWQMSTYTNPFIDPYEIDAAKRDLPELAFSQEYMAEFNENVANPFGSIHIRQNIYELSKNKPAYYGIDLAKSVDWTVIIGLDAAGNVCHFDRFQKDWKHTKDAIMMLDISRPILIDSTGVGDAIVEDLQRSCPNMEGFKFTSHSKQQLIEGLVQSVQRRLITYPDGPIVSEMELFEYNFTSYGVRYSAPAGYHDDCVMALALANKCFIDKKGSGTYSIL